MSKRRKQTDKHHLLPKSRFPPDTTREEIDEGNIVELDQEFHRNWHKLFHNLTTEEAIKMIRIVMTANTRWTRRDLERLRRWLKES